MLEPSIAEVSLIYILQPLKNFQELVTGEIQKGDGRKGTGQKML